MSELQLVHLPQLENNWLYENSTQKVLSINEQEVIEFLSLKIKEYSSISKNQMLLFLQGITYSFLTGANHPFFKNVNNDTVSFFKWIYDHYEMLPATRMEKHL